MHVSFTSVLRPVGALRTSAIKKIYLFISYYFYIAN